MTTVVTEIHAHQSLPVWLRGLVIPTNTCYKMRLCKEVAGVPSASVHDVMVNLAVQHCTGMCSCILTAASITAKMRLNWGHQRKPLIAIGIEMWPLTSARHSRIFIRHRSFIWKRQWCLNRHGQLCSHLTFVLDAILTPNIFNTTWADLVLTVAAVTKMQVQI